MTREVTQQRANMLNMQASIQRIVIILNGPTDWDEWIEIIKTKAIAATVWEYVNPCTAKDALSILEKPTFPWPINVNPQRALISQLAADEKKELQALRQQYKAV
jgi:hypothetical protein